MGGRTFTLLRLAESLTSVEPDHQIAPDCLIACHLVITSFGGLIPGRLAGLFIALHLKSRTIVSMGGR